MHQFLSCLILTVLAAWLAPFPGFGPAPAAATDPGQAQHGTTPVPRTVKPVREDLPQEPAGGGGGVEGQVFGGAGDGLIQDLESAADGPFVQLLVRIVQ